MEIRMELNQRFGRGFQIRLISGPVNKVYDQDPLNMYEAGVYARTLLEMMNKELGASYELHQVVRVPGDALEANAKTDFAAARMLQDIKSKRFELSIPAEQDMTMIEVDGRKEPAFSPRGVVLVTLFTWRDDANQKAHDALRRYCEYICMHGNPGGAVKALAELDGLDKDRAAEWVRRTYAQYVQDGGALVQYVMTAS